MPARPQASLNLGILAHVDAGKTTLTERLLHLAGVIDAPGSVDSGTTRPTRSRSSAVAASRSRPPWSRSRSATRPSTSSTPRATPTSSPRWSASLGVLDGAVLVLSAVEGVQPQTRILMRALQRLRVPTLLFVNKVDRVGADLDGVVDAIRRRLTADVLPMGYVVGSGTRAATFTPYRPDDRTFLDRETEVLAEHDDALLASYVDGQPLRPGPAAPGGGRPDRCGACCTRCTPARRRPAPASPT